MGTYERKDKYYQRAKDEGRASRASYKIEEIQQKFRLIKRGDVVVDLGCAPGGWLQVIAEWVGKEGSVLGIDTETPSIKIAPPISFIKSDVFEGDLIEKIESTLPRKADLFLSDLAPHTTGIKFKDSFLSYELANRALEIAKSFLKAGGNFVTKIFPGKEQEGLQKELKGLFSSVKHFVPKATRKTSNEFYIVAVGYIGRE